MARRGHRQLPVGSRRHSRTHAISGGRPLHPEVSSVHGEAEMAVKLAGRDLLWRGILDAHSDRQNFYVQYQRELRENGKIIRSKLWDATVPRDGQ